MITKLLKHEFIRTRAEIGVIFGATVLLVASALVVTSLSIPLLQNLLPTVAVITVSTLLVATQLTLTKHYWRSSYREQGYFTHSIPVRGSTIFWAKQLWMWLITLAALVLTVLLGLVCAWAFLPQFGMHTDPWAFLQQIGEAVGVAHQAIGTGYMALLVVSVVALVLSWGTSYLFSASIGSEGRLGRLGAGGPILVFFLLYAVGQVVTMLSIWAIPLGITADAAGQVGIGPVNYLPGSEESGSNVPLGLFLAGALIFTGCLWRTHYSWNRKVSLQ